MRRIKRETGIAFLIIMMNVASIGVIQTSSFFILDIVSYVIFSLAALVFFKRKLWLLSLISCIGILIKDISIVLIIPMIFLCYEKNHHKISSLLLILLPVFTFIGLRYFMYEDLLYVQYSWNITKGEIKTNHLKMHLGRIRQILDFSLKVLMSIGGGMLMTMVLFYHYKREKMLFFYNHFACWECCIC